MVPIARPETSVGNYHYLMRNNSEMRSSQLASTLKILGARRSDMLTRSIFHTDSPQIGYYAPTYKIYSPWRRDARGLFIPPQTFLVTGTG